MSAVERARRSMLAGGLSAVVADRALACIGAEGLQVVEVRDGERLVRVDELKGAIEAIAYLRSQLAVPVAELPLPISVVAYAVGLIRAYGSVHMPRPVAKRAARAAEAFAGRTTRQGDGAAPAAASEEAVQPAGSGPVGPAPEQAGDAFRGDECEVDGPHEPRAHTFDDDMRPTSWVCRVCGVSTEAPGSSS